MKAVQYKPLRELIILVLFLLSVPAHGQFDPVKYVDNRLGTYNDASNCVIGPQLPFGSINPSPQTPNGDHDGYNPDEPIRGFGQLHVSGTGWGKYGQIFVSPQTGLAVGETAHDSPKTNETAAPYEYGVTLTRYNIRTEVTPSFHSALYRFIFPESDSAHILFDLTHNIPMDIATNVGGEVSGGTIEIDDTGTKFSGYGTYSGGFGGGEYTVYFAAALDRKPAITGTWKNNKITPGKNSETISVKNDRVGAYAGLVTAQDDTINLRVAVSFKSIERAREWLEAEVSGKTYDEVRHTAYDTWKNALSKIKISGATSDEYKIFYTALYHSMLMPRNRTNDIKGFEDGVPVWDDQYATWDTWRTLFPLLGLIQPGVVAGNVNSFSERLKTDHRVSDAFIAGNEMAEEQGGNDVDNIIADAIVKDIPGINRDDAYAVIMEHAEGPTGRNGWQGFGNTTIVNPLMNRYKEYGWIPAGTMSCSYSLEYAYNDNSAGLVAEKLGHTSEAAKLFERSHQWTHLWDSASVSDGYAGFIIPRDADGKFIEINPKKDWGSWHDYFYEGSSWTYSWFTPHDFCKLVELNGGHKACAEKLKYGFDHQLINPGNEPSFLTAFSFIYMNRPDLASLYARLNMARNYSTTGLPGNDDSGAMSSWYIFAAMGFFPNAGQDLYYLTGPLFDSISIDLGENKNLVIMAKNGSMSHTYVRSCKINGKDWPHAWINHEMIKNGAVIEFDMALQPTEWAKNDTTLCSKPESDDTLVSIRGQNYKGHPMIISPNPCRSSASVNLVLPEKARDVRLFLTNNAGLRCKTINIEKRGVTDYLIDMEGISTGIYMLNLEIDGKLKAVGKIVKI